MIFLVEINCGYAIKNPCRSKLRLPLLGSLRAGNVPAHTVSD